MLLLFPLGADSGRGPEMEGPVLKLTPHFRGKTVIHI